MITITLGGHSRIVTEADYEKHYKDLGYKPEPKQEDKPQKAVSKKPEAAK